KQLYGGFVEVELQLDANDFLVGKQSNVGWLRYTDRAGNHCTNVELRNCREVANGQLRLPPGVWAISVDAGSIGEWDSRNNWLTLHQHGIQRWFLDYGVNAREERFADFDLGQGFRGIAKLYLDG